jgi:SpoVK/Ycf46/Vps4 family AAA+-type ATPase
MDGFDSLGKTKVIMATNRPDTLDPALLRPGRLDRKIEIPLPNEQSRLEILKIHARPVNKQGEIDYEAMVKLSDGFNGADLRNVCTEAGMFAIRDDREHCLQEDFMKASHRRSPSRKRTRADPSLLLLVRLCASCRTPKSTRPRWTTRPSEGPTFALRSDGKGSCRCACRAPIEFAVESGSQERCRRKNALKILLSY